MVELKYSFHELLRSFFEPHKSRGMTQAELAEKIGVALNTVNTWFTGRAKPRFPRDVERLIDVLKLEPLEADLLLYSIKPTWIKYGSDPEDLANYIIVRPKPQNNVAEISSDDATNELSPIPKTSNKRFLIPTVVILLILFGLIAILVNRSNNSSQQGLNTATITTSDNISLLPSRFTAPIQLTEPISPTEIERTWTAVFTDTFDDNRNYWILGTKIDPNGELVKSIENGVYTLTHTPTITVAIFMGGDSPFFAPNTYYLSVDVTRTKADSEEDGCGLFFDTVNDGLASVFRLRNETQRATIASFTDWSKFTIYLNRIFVPETHPQAANKLAILANGNQFFFFINDTQFGTALMPRVTHSTLNMAIIAGDGKPRMVRCEFDNLQVLVPPQK